MVRCMQAAPERALDFETNGLKWANGKKPIGYSMGFFASDNRHYAWYVPVAHKRPEPQADLGHAKQALADGLRGAQAIIMHHGKFDLNMARANGYEIPEWCEVHDTLPQAYLIYEGRPMNLEALVAQHSLSPWGDAHQCKAEVEVFLKQRAKDHKLNWKKRSKVTGKDSYMETFGHSEVPIALEGEYSCRDIGHTLALDRYQRPLARGIGTRYEQRRRHLYTNEMLLVRALADMEYHGQLVDRDYLMEQAMLLDEDLEKRDRELGVVWGARIQWNNDNELREFLFDHLKMPEINKTPKGQPSVDRSTLLQLRAKRPSFADALNQLAEYKARYKTRSTYTESLALEVCRDGRIHCSFKQQGAKSGRLSSYQPNLQNIPTRHVEMAKLVRRAFIIEPGKVRVLADYSQIELRMLGWITGSRTLLDAYKSPAWEAYRRGRTTYDQYRQARKAEPSVDVHGLQAQKIFSSNPAAADWKLKRRAAKIINFGVPYGMTWMGLNGNPELLLPEAEAKDYFEKYHQGNPEIKSAKKRLFNTMMRERDPFFVNWAGRTVHSPNVRAAEHWIRREAERSAFASLVQGAAAELTRVSMVRLWYESRTGTLPAVGTSTVHDEIQLDCNRSDLPFVAARVQEVMEDFHGYFGSTPVICDIEKTETNWAEKEEYIV